MFIFYRLVSNSKSKFWWWFIGGLALRLVLIFSFPTWSDDYARFLWDGELVSMSQNPYKETPENWLTENAELKTAYLDHLFRVMNSPAYYSVYPPSNQLIFWLGSIGANQDIKQGIITLRILLILVEIGVFWLLFSLLRDSHLDNKSVILYWFNPLVILEITGNLHFEGLVLAALLLSLWALKKNKLVASGAFWSLAVGIKILPLMLGPSLLGSSVIRKSKVFWVTSGLVLIALFSPLIWDGSWANLLESIRLYQGKFEFNASVYYLLREVGFWIKGYNTIAVLTKGLSILTFAFLVYLAWKKQPKTYTQLAGVWTLSYLIYLILQPVVHPWYIIPAFGLSLLTKMKSLAFWTFSVIFSYQAYGNPNNYENPWFLFLEYGIVALALIWDYKEGKFNFRTDTLAIHEK